MSLVPSSSSPFLSSLLHAPTLTLIPPPLSTVVIIILSPHTFLPHFPLTNPVPKSGQFYGIAAAIGKIGAFVGTWVFPVIQDNAPNATRKGQDPFWVASALAIFAGVVALFFLPDVGQDTIDEEDVRFREYLQSNGFDTSLMGLKDAREAEVESGSDTGRVEAVKT